MEKKAATIPKTPPERDTKIKAVHEQIAENNAKPEPVKPKPLNFLLNKRYIFNEIVVPDKTETMMT